MGIELLDDFFWLKRSANAMLPPNTPGVGTAEERQEWETRAAKFKQNVNDILTLFAKLCSCQNRELVNDLYTYLWDICGVVQTLEGFVQWMSKGYCAPKSQHYVVGQQTWFSGIREAFLSGEHEPWMFRGGLISDLQRLLPLDSGNDLYMYKFPDVPASLLYYVRPFMPKDEEAIYGLAATSFEETIDAPMGENRYEISCWGKNKRELFLSGLCATDRELVGDRTVGAYLTLCPEYTFVVENSTDQSIVAYAVVAPDAKTFFTRYSVAWLPEMRLKYPLKKNAADEEMLTPIERMAASFHAADAEPLMPPVLQANAEQLAQPWGVATMNVAANVSDVSLAKRLTMLVLACLRASGTFRLFVEVKAADLKMREFYASLGFQLMIAPAAGVGGAADVSEAVKNEETLYMSRSF